MYKVDQYIVKRKGKSYKILVFPRVENAWAYDDSPEGEDRLMLDGNVEFYTMLKYAMAALIADPSLLIYFPIKKPGCRRFGDCMTYDAVLLRPELQFRRSAWHDIKGKLDQQHYAGQYKIICNDAKLNDWYVKTFRNKEWFLYKERARIVEELLGETLFLVLPKNICYMYHYEIFDSLLTLDYTYEYGWYSHIGYLFSDEVLQKQKDDKQ